MDSAAKDRRSDRRRTRTSGWSDQAQRAGELALQSAKDFFVDSGPQWAASLAYYALLSSLPLLLVGLSVAAFFVDPNWVVDRLTSLLKDFVPQENTISDIVKEAIQARQQVGLLSFVGLLWSGTRVFGTLTRALNIAFDAENPYSFAMRLLMEAAMLLTIGALAVIALASGVLLDPLWTVLHLVPAGRGVLVNAVEWIIRAALLLGTFFLIFRFVPSTRPNWRSAAVGATVSTLLFVVASPLFQYYIDRFGSVNLIYGSLAVVVTVLIWVWITAMITLFGGEVASHYQDMVLEGKSSAQVASSHAQRAPTKRERREGKGRL